MIYTIQNIDECSLTCGDSVIYCTAKYWRVGYYIGKRFNMSSKTDIQSETIGKALCFVVVTSLKNENNPKYWKFVNKIKVDNDE